MIYIVIIQLYSRLSTLKAEHYTETLYQQQYPSSDSSVCQDIVFVV